MTVLETVDDTEGECTVESLVGAGEGCFESNTIPSESTRKARLKMKKMTGSD